MTTYTLNATVTPTSHEVGVWLKFSSGDFWLAELSDAFTAACQIVFLYINACQIVFLSINACKIVFLSINECQIVFLSINAC